jgi:hypothetical protein
MCSVFVIVCVVLCTVFCLSMVCVICVLCLIVVSLPPGKNPFAVKENKFILKFMQKYIFILLNHSSLNNLATQSTKALDTLVENQ